MIVIIDYGLGNVGSIKNMLEYLDEVEVSISADSEVIAKADKLILPGVGSFDYGMEKLKEMNIIDILNKKVLVDKVPILGICLGAQLLTNSSEEGNQKGLGWIDAKTVAWNIQKTKDDLKIPNMGWRSVDVRKSIPLLVDLPSEPRFYFVHSFHFDVKDVENVAMTTVYGYEYAAAICKENIVGVQFHPEKSHKYGLKLMANFIEKY